ncbi:MAG: tetratricopeptide repeat protein [Deltaproteobacteria bacterium]|nr:tetratricopeptide repeat protein [Deltaproteobacteria bacterium]
MNKKLNYMIPAAAAIVTMLAYLPALQNGFVNWDDQLYVYDNPDIRIMDARFFKLIFTTVLVSNWHPLTMLSYAIDYSIWGLDPFGYHLVSVIFHGLNTFLAGLLATRLTRLATGLDDGRALFTGAVFALLFGLHPLHVESVAWVSERKDVLSGFFFFLSILSYLRYKRGHVSGYFCALLFFILSFMSKPMTITLPAVLLILDYYPLKAGLRKSILEKVPFFALGGLFTATTLWAQGSDNAIAPLTPYPISSRILVAARGFIFYLYKTILPSGLAPFYPRDLSPRLFSLEYLGAFALLFIIFLFCIIYIKKNRAYISGWLFYLVTLLPVIGIIQVGSQAAADRYTYLPSIGPFMLIAAGAGYLFARKKTAAVIIAAITSLLLASCTVRQVYVWKDSISLWSHEVRVYPNDAPLGYSNLGIAYKAIGDYDKAIYSYNKALEIDPDYADAYSNRGVVYMRLGRFNEGLDDFTNAIRLNPDNPETYGNRGVAYINTGNYGEAIEDLSRSISLSPNPKSYFNRGTAHKALGDYRAALLDFDKAIELNPLFSGAYNNRGGVFLRTGDLDRAIADFVVATTQAPGESTAYYNLGLAYARSGDKENAVESFRKASGLGLKQADEYLRQLGY